MVDLSLWGAERPALPPVVPAPPSAGAGLTLLRSDKKTCRQTHTKPAAAPSAANDAAPSVQFDDVPARSAKRKGTALEL